MMTCICWNGVLFVTEIKRAELIYFIKVNMLIACAVAELLENMVFVGIVHLYGV